MMTTTVVLACIGGGLISAVLWLACHLVSGILFHAGLDLREAVALMLAMVGLVVLCAPLFIWFLRIIIQYLGGAS